MGTAAPTSTKRGEGCLQALLDVFSMQDFILAAQPCLHPTHLLQRGALGKAAAGFTSGQNLDCVKIILWGFPIHESIPGLSHTLCGRRKPPHTGTEEWNGQWPCRFILYPAGHVSLRHPLVPPGGNGSTHLTRVVVRSNEWK